MSTDLERPTSDESFFFDTYGYLVLEGFLPSDLVETLMRRLEAAIERRRQGDTAELFRSEMPHPTGETEVNGASSRIYYILNDDPLLLDMLDYPPVMPYVHAFLSPRPHFHAPDAIWEVGSRRPGPGWHRDGINGYRAFLPRIPMLQLKIGYFLSDMSRPDQGNLTIVPGSHKSSLELEPIQVSTFDSLPGATQVCGPPGTAVLFHNALWRTPGPWTASGGQRVVTYYAYEHSWMMASPEPYSYPRSFYEGLSPERRELFHRFVFELR